MQTLIKALTWRFIALTCTATVVFWETGGLEMALSIGLIDSVIKIGLYYAHEKAWMRGLPRLTANKRNISA